MSLFDRRYRVIQVATGNVGRVSLRSIIEHPLFDLVGVLVFSDDKVGKDACELCDLTAPTGVKATKNFEEIVSLKADAVAYMPRYVDFDPRFQAFEENELSKTDGVAYMLRYVDFDHISRLLASGKNIGTTRGEFLNPITLSPEERTLIEKGCEEGNSSIRSLGSSPGTATEMLPLILLSYQRRLDRVIINEYANMTSRTNSYDMMFVQMGFGGKPNPSGVGEMMVKSVYNDFGGSLNLIAEGLGVKLDDITMKSEIGIAKSDHQAASGFIPKGTIGAFRLSLNAVHKGRAIILYRAHWYCTPDVETPTGEDWGLDAVVQNGGFLIKCEGDANWDMKISYPVPLDYYPKLTPTLAAYPVVNMIPQLVAAPAGIRTTLDFPVPRTYFDL